jgi:general secretion pathway protein G
MKKNAGFTLIEVMVVVVILAILASVVVPRIINRPDDAKVVKAHLDIQAIEGGLEMYRLDNGSYPTTDQGLRALVEKPTIEPIPSNWKAGGYIQQLRMDPWDHPYQYLNPGVHGEFDLFSYGADGKPGGEGLDGDIGNWTDTKAPAKNGAR